MLTRRMLPTIPVAGAPRNGKPYVSTSIDVAQRAQAESRFETPRCNLPWRIHNWWNGAFDSDNRIHAVQERLGSLSQYF
jgi:hypothetical protein